LSIVPNIYRPVFEDGERPAGFRSRRARVGYEVGVGERLARGGGLRAFLRRELAVDYWDRESPPGGGTDGR
jgi:hypothetical protein